MRNLLTILLGLFITTASLADNFTIKSTAFSDNGNIPILYSCNGKDISPPLTWSNAPANTKSYALVLSSPDWSAGYVNLWIIYNIPSNIKKLPEDANENLPSGTLVGNNYYNETKYNGPCPPDDLIHHYVFTIYALDNIIDVPAGADIDDIMIKIKHHILKQTQLTGVFRH